MGLALGHDWGPEKGLKIVFAHKSSDLNKIC